MGTGQLGDAEQTDRGQAALTVKSTMRYMKQSITLSLLLHHSTIVLTHWCYC